MQFRSDKRAEIEDKLLLMVLATALSSLEFFIPRIPLIPWMKPGFANIITLIFIIRYGFKDSLLLILLRMWIVSFYFGFSIITVSIGLCGSILAVSTEQLLWNTLGKRNIMGITGMSIAGALMHNTGQLFAAYQIMHTSEFISKQIPLMLIASVIFGLTNGFLAFKLYKLTHNRKVKNIVKHLEIPTEQITFKLGFLSISVLIFSISILFIKSELPLIISSVAILITAFKISNFSIKPLLNPLKTFRVIFIVTAVAVLSNPFGHKFEAIPFITHESLHELSLIWLRLLIWLELSIIFKHIKFHILIFSFLRNTFPDNYETLYAGITVLEYFPLITEATFNVKSIKSIKLLFKDPNTLFRTLISNAEEILILDD